MASLLRFVEVDLMSMTGGDGFWWYVILEGKDGDEDVLASLAELSGSIGAEQQQGAERIRLRAYFRNSHDLGFWLGRLGEALEPWPNIALVDMGKIENRQWHTAWKDAFPPLDVGRRFVVLAPWHRGKEPLGRIPLYIYPGSAFGTGYHESTQIMLELLESHAFPGMTAVDIGSGSGILSIAAVKLGAVSVTARDLDPAVIPEIEENCRLNDLPAGRIRVETGDLLRGFTSSVDCLLANIVLEPLLEMLPSVCSLLREKGFALFSGLVVREREQFLSALDWAGLVPLEEREKGDWWGVAAAPSTRNESANA